MRSAAKPWSPAAKVGGHGSDRARALATASSGMKSSKSSTSLACESQLSKVQPKTHRVRAGCPVSARGMGGQGVKLVASRAGARPPGRARGNLKGQSKGLVAGALGMEAEVCQMFPGSQVPCPGLMDCPGRALPRTPQMGSGSLMIW